ncbi:hypothetical protein [Bradyrhizobium sp. 5.13L]
MNRSSPVTFQKIFEKPSRKGHLHRNTHWRPGRQSMEDEATHLSLGKLRPIIGRLRGPDLARLSLLGRVWAAGLRYHDTDDLLLYEAFDCVLSGRRLWPSEVPLPTFLSQAMRSIANVLTVLPMLHVGSLNIQTTPALHHGATITMHKRFTPDATPAAFDRDRPTLTER